MRSRKAVFLSLVSFLFSGFAQSEESAPGNSVFNDTHILSIGATRQSTEVTIAATTENFAPTPITLEDLGVENRDNSYFVDYRYRFKPRWSMFAGAYSFAGTGENISTRDFNFDGQEFTAETRIRANLDIDTYILDILYAVHRSDKVEVLLGGGLHALDFGVGLAGSIEVDGELREAGAAGATLLAPVPNLRGSVTWELSDRIVFNAVGGWLSANVDEYEGDFTYLHLRGFYRFGQNFGVSAGYQFTDIDIRQNRARSTIDVNAQLDGPTVTLTYSF